MISRSIPGTNGCARTTVRRTIFRSSGSIASRSSNVGVPGSTRLYDGPSIET
jgi:hypothetical protein